MTRVEKHSSRAQPDLLLLIPTSVACAKHLTSNTQDPDEYQDFQQGANAVELFSLDGVFCPFGPWPALGRDDKVCTRMVDSLPGFRPTIAHVK
jgi:hypothetical protein